MYIPKCQRKEDSKTLLRAYKPWKPFFWFQLGLMYILPVFKEREIRKSGAISMCSLRSNESAKFCKSCKDKFSDLKLGRAEKQKMSFEKRQNEISSNDSDVTPENLEMPCSSKSSVLTRRNSNEKNEVAKEHCLFCSGKEGNLHIVSTFRLDTKVQQCARTLEDNFLFGKLNSGDMVALDAMYHAKCLIALCNKANQQLYGRDYTDNEKHLNGIVLAELASFMEQTANTVHGVLKLTELGKMYRDRLIELRGQAAERIHTARLKSRLLSHFEDLTEFKQGKNTFVAFNMEVGNALKIITRTIMTTKLSYYHEQPTFYGKIFLIKTIKHLKGLSPLNVKTSPPPLPPHLHLNCL